MKFRFRKFGLAVFFGIWALLMLAAFIKGMMENHPDLLGAAVCVFGVLFLTSCASFGYIDNCDLVIDDDGIRRIIFDKNIVWMKWVDVKLIRDVVTGGDEAYSFRFFYIVTGESDSLSFLQKRLTRLSVPKFNFHEFVDVINKQIKLHGIKVERVRGSSVDICDEISVRDVEDFRMPWMRGPVAGQDQQKHGSE